MYEEDNKRQEAMEAGLDSMDELLYNVDFKEGSMYAELME